MICTCSTFLQQGKHFQLTFYIYKGWDGAFSSCCLMNVTRVIFLVYDTGRLKWKSSELIENNLLLSWKKKNIQFNHSVIGFPVYLGHLHGKLTLIPSSNLFTWSSGQPLDYISQFLTFRTKGDNSLSFCYLLEFLVTFLGNYYTHSWAWVCCECESDFNQRC